MAQKHHLVLSRMAMVLAICALSISAVSYAQTTSPTSTTSSQPSNFTVYTYKSETIPANGIQVQQIYTELGKVKKYCVSDSAGKCSFAISADDGFVHFLGGIVDSATGKRGENYGGATNSADPSYNCKIVTFKYDAPSGKVHRYLDGVLDDSALAYTIYPESYYKSRCVANSRGGYDAVAKDTGSAGSTSLPSSGPSSSEEDDDFIEDEAGEIDFALIDVKNPKFGKVKASQAPNAPLTEQLRFTAQLNSDSDQKEDIYFSSLCFAISSMERVTLAKSMSITKINPGDSALKLQLPLANEGKALWNSLKKRKGKFNCDFQISGYFPADTADQAVTAAVADADDTNNYIGLTLQWKKVGRAYRLQIVSKTTAR